MAVFIPGIVNTSRFTGIPGGTVRIIPMGQRRAQDTSIGFLGSGEAFQVTTWVDSTGSTAYGHLGQTSGEVQQRELEWFIWPCGLFSGHTIQGWWAKYFESQHLGN